MFKFISRLLWILDYRKSDKKYWKDGKYRG